MNVLKPDLASVKTSVESFFKGLGLIPSLCLFAIVVLLIWYSATSVADSFRAHATDKQVQAALQQAEDYKKQASAAQTEAEQFRGAAAAYKEQADALNAERTELLNARPDLQQKVADAHARVESIRQRPIRPIDNAIEQRVADLGTKLDNLYPDK